MKTLVCAFLYDRKEIVLCPFRMTGKKLLLFVNEVVSDYSTHGNVVWNQMRLTF